MATRSLSEVFILMRNNALQSRHILSEQCVDDRVALVQHNRRDLEQGLLGISSKDCEKPPPEWIDGVEEVHYEISRIRQKVQELTSLHQKHLTRPTLDDSLEEECGIDIITQEVTQMFWHCQRLIHQINNKGHGGSSQELLINKNVVQSLVSTLQQLSNNFRKSQSSYLKKIQHREERSQHYFGGIDHNSKQQSYGNHNLVDDDDDYQDYVRMLDQGFTQQKLLFVEDNSMMSEQREKEILHIVHSITELNDIFKDLANIVVDQGTVLDRIDYNIENSQIQVSEGLKQLQKAEGYQKKNRKMMFILFLAVMTVTLIIILIAVKS